MEGAGPARCLPSTAPAQYVTMASSSGYNWHRRVRQPLLPEDSEREARPGPVSGGRRRARAEGTVVSKDKVHSNKGVWGGNHLDGGH